MTAATLTEECYQNKPQTASDKPQTQTSHNHLLIEVPPWPRNTRLPHVNSIWTPHSAPTHTNSCWTNHKQLGLLWPINKLLWPTHRHFNLLTDITAALTYKEHWPPYPQPSLPCLEWLGRSNTPSHCQETGEEPSSDNSCVNVTKRYWTEHIQHWLTKAHYSSTHANVLIQTWIIWKEFSTAAITIHILFTYTYRLPSTPANCWHSQVN